MGLDPRHLALIVRCYVMLCLLCTKPSDRHADSFLQAWWIVPTAARNNCPEIRSGCLVAISAEKASVPRLQDASRMCHDGPTPAVSCHVARPRDYLASAVQQGKRSKPTYISDAECGALKTTRMQGDSFFWVVVPVLLSNCSKSPSARRSGRDVQIDHAWHNLTRTTEAGVNA